MSVDVRAALARLAERLGGRGARLLDAQRLSGGASMETWEFTILTERGANGFILRRRPHAVPADSRSITLEAEAILIRATAANGVPVPALIHLCDEEDGLGEAHVTLRVAGETLGKKIVSDPRFDGVRPGLARQCGEVLARIHGTRPPPEAYIGASDAAGELDRYEKAYRLTKAERPIFELAFQHLRKKMPTPVVPSLVHGDFRNGNLLIDPEIGVAAVLDWELAHIGDPAADLGWLCVNSWRFGRPDRPVGGFGQYAALLEGYEAASGRRIPLDRVRYWEALGSLRWGVMCLMMYQSWSEGPESSVERPMIGRRVSETEADLIHLLEEGI
jgi:aminoglycoside phosphotransferase (APT) family kinase protein